MVPFRGHDLDRVEKRYSGGGAEMATATGTFMLGGGEAKRRYGDEILVMMADTLANGHSRHQDFH